MTIICLSNQRFDYPLKTNKWQVMTRLAERGHRVLFVDPPIRIRKLVKLIAVGQFPPRRFLTLTKKVNPNLWVYSPLTLRPSEDPNLITFNTNRINTLVEKISVGVGKVDRWPRVLWVYHPMLLDYVERISHDILLYDCVDEYPSFPNFVRRGLSAEVARREAELAKRADLVLATTPYLVEKLKKHNPNTHFVPNAGDYERFKPVGKGKRRLPADLQGIKRPIIGFTGAIDEYKLNLPLVEKCARAYPEYSFVLIGPTAVADRPPNLASLKSLTNVHFLGVRDYAQLPNYFDHWDAYIIPYNLNDYTRKGCFPVKFFDALAAGLPTVVTNLPAYQPFRRVGYLAEDENDFVARLGQAVEENSPAKAKARRQVARDNSWEAKVDNQLKLLQKHVSRG